MAVVLDASDHVTPVGIITLDDVFSILIDSDLLDEFDMLQERRMWEKEHMHTERSEPIAVNHALRNENCRSTSHPLPYHTPENGRDQMPASQSLQFPPNQGLRELLLRSKSIASGGLSSTIFLQPPPPTSSSYSSVSIPRITINKSKTVTSESSHLLETELQVTSSHKKKPVVMRNPSE